MKTICGDFADDGDRVTVTVPEAVAHLLSGASLITYVRLDGAVHATASLSAEHAARVEAALASGA